MRVTITDVAVKANVSVNTVSRALNGKDGVSEATRARIVEIARELNYRPNILARNMRQDKASFIGVLVMDIGNSIFSKMIKGIEGELVGKDLSIIIGNSDENVAKERHYLETMIMTNCRGVIISHVSSSGLMFLRQENIPFVVLDRDTQGFACDQVFVDNTEMGYSATKHLLELGHRDIIFINKKSQFDTDHKRRAQGYCNALHEYAMEESARVYDCVDAEDGKEAIEKIWGHKAAPTGIVIGQHSVAEGVLAKLTALQVKIPDEVSIVIIGEPSWASILPITLTTIERPLERIGRMAARLLLERTESKIKEGYSSCVVPSHLVVRGSSEPPPAKRANGHVISGRVFK